MFSEQSNDGVAPTSLGLDTADRTSPLQTSLRRGTWQLLQAHEYAVDLARDPWDFAVEVFALRSSGVTMADLRWLIYKGFANHGREFTVAGDTERRIQKGGQFLPTNRSCMVLTDAGVEFARTLRLGEPKKPLERAVVLDIGEDRCGPSGANSCGEPPIPPWNSLPKWDRNRRELWYNGQLVKQFKLPSANQETIIMAFEEESWAPRVDDPLPPAPDIDPKRRLNDAIKGLNRRQKNQCIRFMGDGRGLGIIWEGVGGVAK